MRLRRRTSFDERAYEVAAERMSRALAAGLDEDAADALATEAFSKALDEAFDKSVPRVTERLIRTAPRMLRWHRRQQRAFERRLRKHWGRALDLFFAVVVSAEEAGATFNTTHRPAAADRQDFVFEALTGLHARACRTAFEVHRLLSSGFPKGALSRCRTLHELAVTSIVIGEHGREAAYSDLAERFLLHEVVIGYKDALVFQENCRTLGYEPFSNEEMTEMKRGHDELVQRYGPAFGKPYGWASGLSGPEPTFRDLERVAELAHLRSHYRWMSHEVHSTAKGSALNVYESGSAAIRLSGMTNTGLAEPGHLALISLHQCTGYLLIRGTDSISPLDLLALMAIQNLVDRAGEAFGAAQDSIDQAESRFKAREASRRFGFFGGGASRT
jgi:hypothetical protein